MVTIKYYDGTKTIDVEVTEEFAEAYKQMCREEQRVNKRERRHKACSLDQIEDEDGYQLVDLLTADPIDEMIEQENQAELRNKIKAAMATLTPEQKELVKMLKNGMSITEVADELGKEYQSVWDMRERIQKNFKKFL